MRLLEKEFYDYRTAPVVGDQVVDLHRTGTSYYDDFLTGSEQTKEYLRKEKNLEGEVVMMSPEEYYKECAEYAFPNSNVSVESLKGGRRRDSETLSYLKDVLMVHKRRFTMPYINKADPGQEGLHRMMVIGDLLGWDHKVPVLVVDWADKQRAFEEAKRKRIEKIEYRIRRAVQDTLYYKFNNIDELREQLQWELDKQFDLDDNVSTPVQFELTSDEQTKEFIVTIGAATYSFDYEDVEFMNPEEDDLDIEDLDLEETDEILKKYFGDDWRETHPHLKNTFNIKESLFLESSSKNYLFHGTKNIHEILDSNKLMLGRRYAKEQAVCLSRSFEFVSKFPYILVLDKDKLKSKYSLKLRSDSKNNIRQNFARYSSQPSKAEEVCLTEISDLKNYIICIVTDDETLDFPNIIPKQSLTRYTLNNKIDEFESIVD